MLRKQTLVGAACLLLVGSLFPCGFAKAGDDPLNRAFGHLPTMEESFGHLPTMDEAYGVHDNSPSDSQQSQPQSNEDEKPMVGYSANSPTVYTHQRGGDWTISGPEGNVTIHDEGNTTTYTRSRPGGPISTTTCIRLANHTIQCSQH